MNRLAVDFADDERIALPPIRVLGDDARRLISLAETAMERLPRVSHFLAREMERATVVASEAEMQGAIGMGSEVTYRDESSGAVRKVVLVFPHEADIGVGRISILTPVGAALIGLSTGQRIEFQTPDGQTKELTVVAVCGYQ